MNAGDGVQGQKWQERQRAEIQSVAGDNLLIKLKDSVGNPSEPSPYDLA